MKTLECHQLTKQYKQRQVVKGVSLALNQGEIVGLLGSNGAGKTTCFHMLVGLIFADFGHIYLDKQDITSLPLYQRARLGVGYLPQESSVFKQLSVRDNLMGILELKRYKKKEQRRIFDQVVGDFNIERVLEQQGSALSGGERRRVEIARALMMDPMFLLLDEPFAGVDPISVKDIQALILQLKKKGIGVLITDHNVRETLGIVDRAYLIHLGEILVEGSAQDIVSSALAQRVYLGEDFRLL